MAKGNKKHRAAVDDICNRLQTYYDEMGEVQVAFQWRGDDLFILRTFDGGGGYVSNGVYQLNTAAQSKFLKFFHAEMLDMDVDEDNLFSCSTWDELEIHKLVDFGE